MTAIPGIRMARLAGALFGVALAVAVVLTSQPAGGEAVGADVSAYSNQTGELAIDPAGPANFIHSLDLRPGASTDGSFRVTNQTGQAEVLRPAAVPSDHDLDRSLTVTISSGPRTLASGPLGSLAEGAGDPLVLGPGATATVSVRLSLAPDAGSKVAAALVGIAIVFETGAPETNGGIAR
jgi:hypothetical protein